MTGSGDASTVTDSCVLACRSCRAGLTVDRSQTWFDCPCGAVNFIRGCARCEGTTIAASRNRKQPPSWSCPWCLHENMGASLSRKHRAGAATVADAWASLEGHGLTGGDPDARLLGGFTMVAGSGDCPPVDTLCSIAGLKAGVLVVAELGAKGSSLLRYDELLGIEVGGRGAINTGRDYAGGGFGIRGALTGIALARALSAVSAKTLIDSFIRITSRHTEMVLSHWKYSPDTVRNTLSMMFIRYQTAQQAPAAPPLPPPPPAATPVDELERLTRLHAAGTLTDTEFETARAKQIGKLRNPGP